MFFSSDNFIEREHRQMVLRRIFRRVFLEDWLVKLIALLISVGLWLGVTGLSTPTSKTFSDVTLNLNFSNDFEVVNTPPKDIKIIVTGDKRKVDQLKESDLVVSADLTDLKQGDRIVQLTPNSVNIELPNGVKLDEIIPNKISVHLERVEEREVEVKAETEGSVADGFEIYNQTVVPAKVRVRGAESFVKSLDSVTTEKINIENRNQDFTVRQIGLNIVNPNITVLDGIVDVIFKIGEKRAERIFVIPVKAEHGTKKASVVLYGPRSILENIRTENLKVELTKSDTGEAVPEVILPPDIQNKIEVRKIKLSD